MAQKKLYRFAQIKTFPNVLEYPENIAGNWKAFFKNDHPIVLELACGRGEYTLGLATMHPGVNVIGVDVKGNRMFIGAKSALDRNLNNVAFLRTQIEMLQQYFAAGEVDEIWITFPDPHLRTAHAKKRLTHPRFLRHYASILKPGGSIHLKTDSPHLFRFTQKVIDRYELHLISSSDNVYGEPHKAELDIKTHYEGMDIAQSKRIHYLEFCLPQTIPDRDKALQEELKTFENTTP